MPIAQRTRNSCRIIPFSPRKESLRVTHEAIRSFIFSDQECVHIVPYEDMLYLEADGNYTSIYLRSGAKCTISKPLKSIEGKLPSAMFGRVHRSFVVSFFYIRKITREKIVLIDNVEIPVSRRRRKEIVTLFKKS